MELMYPIAIIVCLILSLAIFFINFNKKTKYTNGKKVANTKYIKETEYYKSKVKRYKILSTLIKVLSVICIGVTSILVARPVTVQTKSEDRFNRDIIIALDISTSQSKVNLELTKKIKNMITSIEGDRIGIVLYNTAPLVFCPLTNDYDYINESLDIIERQLKLDIQKEDSYSTLEDNYFTIEDNELEEEYYMFWHGGTVANSEKRGSSLVGDGLARSIIFISKYKNR